MYRLFCNFIDISEISSSQSADQLISDSKCQLLRAVTGVEHQRALTGWIHIIN